MRADCDLDLVLLRPRSPGLKELLRRRVMRSESTEECDSREADRLLRLIGALWRPAREEPVSWVRRRGGEGDLEGERLVDIVDTESAEDADLDRLRSRLDFLPRSSSFFFRMSSAIPFLRNKSSGTWVVSFGWSLGFRSCCVRDGRDV